MLNVSDGDLIEEIKNDMSLNSYNIISGSIFKLLVLICSQTCSPRV